MPDMVITDQAIKEALDGLLSHPGQSLHVRLYTNNVSPDRTNQDPAQFTEAAYPGYAAVTWVYTPITLLGTHHTQLQPAVCSFNTPSSGGNVDVYGFWVDYIGLDTGIPRVLCAVRFPDAPRTLIVGAAPMTFNTFFEDFDDSL